MRGFLYPCILLPHQYSLICKQNYRSELKFYFGTIYCEKLNLVLDVRIGNSAEALVKRYSHRVLSK